jgi:CHAD domain-containing protein
MSSEIHGLRPDMVFREAAKPAIGQKLDDIFQYEAGTRAGDDIEALHDMRVASRRLRAAMDVFAPCYPRRDFAPLNKLARSLTRALGSVRDRDVQIEALVRYAKKAPAEEQAGVAELTRVLRDERDLYRLEMTQTLDSVDQAGFRHLLYLLLMRNPRAGAKQAKKAGLDPDASLQENARLISVQRVATLYGYVPFIHDPSKVAELHEMRIAAKHLRYALEIFRVCFGPDIDQRIEDVKDVQEQIGEIHDCDVLTEVLRRQLSATAQRRDQELVESVMASVSYTERMSSMRERMAEQALRDPRPGLLSLLAHKVEERNRRYGEFLSWWDEAQQADMRGKLYSCIAAVNGLSESA